MVGLHFLLPKKSTRLRIGRSLTTEVYRANIAGMSALNDEVTTQAIRIADLERKLNALKAMSSDDQLYQAQCILRSLDEEAANLMPRFNEEEREMLIAALQLLLRQEGINRTKVSDLIETIMMMHITKSAADNSDGQI